MYKFAIFVFTIFSALSLSAQISHDLTIYSEDGLEFQLIANGELINEEFAAKVKMENTENDYVNIKINFQDERILSIERKFLQIATPGTEISKPVAAVYSIREKKGKLKVGFVSRSEKKIQPKEVIIIQNQSQQEEPNGIRIKTDNVDVRVGTGGK